MRLAAAALLLLATLGCGPDGDPVLPTSDDDGERVLFEQEVVPLFESQCGTSACHAGFGTRFDDLDPSYFVFPVDGEGHVAGSDRIDKAHQRAVDKLSADGAEFGDLVRKPLDESLGGLAHRGGAQYRSMSDESLDVLLRWAEMARPQDAEPLPPMMQRFGDEIQPILVGKTCMLSSCHGDSSANLVDFDVGFLGVFDRHATRRNYVETQLHLNLETPDPMLSRLIRKTIPLEQGGIPHRGGNAFFDASGNDADLGTILSFVHDLRADLGDDDKGALEGLVFVATDATPRSLFDISAWQPGGDVYSLIPAQPGGQLQNLTASHHSGSVDIRDPAVSYDGQRIAFAMRKSQSDCLNLYVMSRDGGGLVQLTHDSGTPDGLKVANVEPIWGPDDRIYFVSTKSSIIAAHGGEPRSNLWRIDADGGQLIQMTYSAGYELAPGWRLFPAPGEDRPEIRTLDLTFTATRMVGDRMHAPLMRVPPDFRADYHPHYGTQHPEYQIFTQLTQLPDQREPLILMDESNVWEGGALALIDRNLGPVIKDGGESAVVNYIPGLQKLGTPGEDVAHRGYSAAGYYRDPHAMPDGTVVVSHSPTPIDHADVDAQPDPALYRLTIADLPTTMRAVVLDKQLLVDLPGKVETDPRPLFVKRAEEIGDPLHHLENGVDRGTVLNFDQAVQLTVAAEDSPSNTKDFDAMAAEIRYVRVVEEVGIDPTQPASAIGRGGHGVRRVIAEIPALADRSMYLELPAGVPYFVQALDDTRSAAHTFNQWFFVLPGEKLTQVTRREVWNRRCGACHGAASGEPGDTVTKPDLLTQASRVEANYDTDTDSDRGPIPHGIEPSERTEVDFEAHVQPVLSQSCATSGCHVEGEVAPDLSARAGDEGFSGAYEALTADGGDSSNGFAYVDPVSSRARTSYLSEVVLGRELDAPRSFDSGGCPGGASLSLKAVGTLMRWMDLGANYVGTAPNDKPPLPHY
jgi:hypothetical protein